MDNTGMGFRPVPGDTVEYWRDRCFRREEELRVVNRRVEELETAWGAIVVALDEIRKGMEGGQDGR